MESTDTIELPHSYPADFCTPAVETVWSVLLGRFSPVARVKSVLFFSASNPASTPKEWRPKSLLYEAVVDDTVFS